MNKNPLYEKSNELAHLVYKITRVFPKEEVYGVISQLRRAVLSVPLNIVEGYARQSDKSYKQFLLISYGSLKETKYLLSFSFEEGYLSEKDYKESIALADEIGKILWVLIGKVKEKTNF
ncbi:MAG: S23 ribosomal protein [candidate division CPR2 bacterium GW2011_GWC1_39_9]|uniref:S23 ribosomal protein n=1 Tax=candidate division CPR2 bacterium GW2011_GWC2_39_10 TaxID=1618345 RepID=A0A0G0M3P4_UNCC2|nr:MAG: S23 ribosomal protein [candidate division CPR2 bacterium GW2011_GWC2_39_10]KKR34782.1 MAG: S23 ribosomal protein [candidate division CPR2 bacterium GW2011_GWC1_39_9]